MLFDFHNHHGRILQLLPSKELHQAYFSIALRSLALSLVGLFVPMYLLVELGYSFTQTLAFFMLYAAIFAGLTPIAAKFACRFGLKHSILLSVPFYIIYFFSLHQLASQALPLALIAFFQGLAQAFFWMGFHLEFKRVSHKKHRGEEMGLRRAFSLLGGIAGPLIGGIIIKYFGFQPLFLLSAIILAFSALFLFLSKEHHAPYHFSARRMLSKSAWKMETFYFYRGAMHFASTILWPLFMFAVLQDYIQLGVIGTLSGVTIAALSPAVGRFSDKKGKKIIIYLMAPIEAIIWVLRGFSSTFNVFLWITLAHSLTHGILEAPVTALQYDRAKENPVEYFIIREIFMNMGRITILLLVLLTASYIPSFWLVGAGTFLTWIF